MPPLSDSRSSLIRHKWLILSSAAILLPALIVWYFNSNPFGDDPICNGKPVSYWIEKMVDLVGRSEDQQDIITSVEALKTNSPAASRALVTYLSRHSSEEDAFATNLVNSSCFYRLAYWPRSIVNYHRNRRIYRRLAVYNALYYLGTDGEPELPFILKEVMKPQVYRKWDWNWELRLHPVLAAKAWRQLLAMFASTSDINVKTQIIGFLNESPPSYGSYSPDEATKVIEMLRTAIHDKDDGVRYNAVRALGDFANRDRRFLKIDAIEQDFIDALQDSSSSVRWGACVGLGLIGKKDGLAIQPLIDEMSKGDDNLIVAARALGKLDAKKVSADKIKELFFKTKSGSYEEEQLAHALDDMGVRPVIMNDQFLAQFKKDRGVSSFILNESLTYTQDPVMRIKLCTLILNEFNPEHPPSGAIIKIPEDFSNEGRQRYWKETAPQIMKCIEYQNDAGVRGIDNLFITEPLLWSLPEVHEWAIKATASTDESVRQAGWNVLSHDEAPAPVK